MLSTAQQMLQDSRTKIELLRMQIIKVSQAQEEERDGSHGKHKYTYVSVLLIKYSLLKQSVANAM